MDQRTIRRKLKANPLHFLREDAAMFNDVFNIASLRLTKVRENWEAASPDQRKALVKELKAAVRNAERFLVKTEKWPTE